MRCTSFVAGSTRRKCTDPISSRLIGEDLLYCQYADCGQHKHAAHHCTFNPEKATVSNFASPDRVKCSGVRSPGSRTPRPLGVEPCSRYDIASIEALRMIKRGASVITLVSLYLPSPSDHDNPAWISSLLLELEGITRRVSAAGASKPTAWIYL